MKISTYLREMGADQRISSAAPAAAVIRTRGGLRIRVDPSALASSSPVFDHKIERRRKSGKLDHPIPILGVPCDAVVAFIRFLHSPSPRCIKMEEMEMMDRYAMHLMVLSHVYKVRWLKDLCEVELSLRLTADSVVDVLQLARQCDVPKLYLQCMKLLYKEFASVEKTEAWFFLQNNDPSLELEILKFLDEQDMERKRRRRKMKEQKVYLQLAEATECLHHICTEGCTDVGPCDHKPTKLIKDSNSCPSHKTCSVIQNLMKHLASCRSTNRSSCARCKRIWDFLRLHSSICQLTENCKVPLCKQFKLRVQMDDKVDHAKWKLLAKKVLSIKIMSTLAQKRKQEVADKR